jgi:hypothetical protein
LWSHSAFFKEKVNRYKSEFHSFFHQEKLPKFACWEFPDPFKCGTTALVLCKQILICREDILMGKRTRDIPIKFYVTAEEKAALKKRMELIGLKNMSTFLRKLALDGYLLNVDMSCFDKALEDIHGVSKNINQIAKRINSTDNIYAEDMRQLKQKQEEIWQLLKSILSQLP